MSTTRHVHLIGPPGFRDGETVLACKHVLDERLSWSAIEALHFEPPATNFSRGETRLMVQWIVCCKLCASMARLHNCDPVYHECTWHQGKLHAPDCADLPPAA